MQNYILIKKPHVWNNPIIRKLTLIYQVVSAIMTLFVIIQQHVTHSKWLLSM